MQNNLYWGIFMLNEYERKSHIVNIENREKMSFTGINDVPSFNEDDIVLCTDYGEISLKGSNLKIESLDLDTGKVDVSGRITAIIYNDKQAFKGLFKRGMFK